MSYTLNKLEDFWGSGSLPIENIYGDTISNGVYTSVGMDLNSFPGVISTNSKAGIFKKGPPSLGGGLTRPYWWAAKVDNEHTASISIYKIIDSSYAVLEHVTPVLDKMPRSFDFDFNSNGNLVVVAEYDRQLHYYYSFASSSGWITGSDTYQCITPKLLYADSAVFLAYSTLTRRYSPSFNSMDNSRVIHTINYDIMVGDSQFNSPRSAYIELVSFNITDASLLSYTGSIVGIFTGSFSKASVIGTLSGSMGSSYGSRIFENPGWFYSENCMGTLSGSLVGYYSGVVTGSINSKFSGTFEGIYNGTTVLLTGSVPMSGVITGTLDCYMTPDVVDANDNLYYIGSYGETLFLSDMVYENGNRIQISYGIYNTKTQNVRYNSIRSGVRLAYGTNNQLGDTQGTNVSFEFVVPQDQMIVYPQNGFFSTAQFEPSPYLDTRTGVTPAGPAGKHLNSYDRVGFYKAYAVGVGTDVNKVSVQFSLYDETFGNMFNYGGAVPNTYENYRGMAKYIVKAQGFTVASPWIGYPGTTTCTPSTDKWSVMGAFWPSSSLNDTAIYGSHCPFIPIGNLTNGIGGWNDPVAPESYVVTESLGIFDGNFSARPIGVYAGLKLIPRFQNVSSGGLKITGIISQINYPYSSSTTTYNNVVDGQVLNFMLPPYTWRSTDISRAAYDPVMYPRVNLELRVSGSGLNEMSYTSSYQRDSYLIRATNT